MAQVGWGCVLDVFCGVDATLGQLAADVEPLWRSTVAPANDLSWIAPVGFSEWRQLATPAREFATRRRWPATFGDQWLPWTAKPVDAAHALGALGDQELAWLVSHHRLFGLLRLCLALGVVSWRALAGSPGQLQELLALEEVAHFRHHGAEHHVFAGAP